MAKVIVECSHGKDDAEKVTVAFLVAGGALGKGHEVVMFLTQEGVNLAVEGYVEGMQAHAETPPVERLFGQFAEQGGRFFVCPICADVRRVDRDALVSNAEVAGATPLFEWAGDAAMTFNY